jgi:propanol-preferring alcohol dehydrogenase
MKAMRLVDIGKLELMEVDVPKVGGSEVLVKVRAAGVCHTDVHIRSGYIGGMNIKDLGFKLPYTPGHEMAGVVEEVGAEVQGFSKGDVVVVYPWIGDGTCYYCKVGEENLCDNPRQLGIHVDGGFAEYVKIPHYRYLLKIRNLSPIDAAPLCCAGITSYRAVRKAGLDPSKTLVVVGAGGGLGTMAIQIAKAIGMAVIGVDVRDEALEAAKRAGADYVVDGRSSSVVEEIKRLADGRGADAVIDFTGSDKTLSTYPNALAKRGKYIIVGLYGGELRCPSAFAVLNEAEFIGSFIGNLADFIGVVNLAERGKVKPMVTKIMRLEEANEAIDNLEHGKVVGRQILVP